MVHVTCLTLAYGKLSMTPIIVHQSKEYSQGIHFNIPMDRKVHHKQCGYMDRDRCHKVMTQLYSVCGTYPVNSQIIFLDIHDSNFEDLALRNMKCRKIQPFVSKEGDSINDQPYDNGPNVKLTSL